MNHDTPPAGIDSGTAHPARRYDYWLGGKDNYAADRASGDAIAAVWPHIVTAARANRDFLGRAVTHLTTDAGLRQFLDIGTGLPTAANTHDIAQNLAPESRIVYVDNDPLVLTHARALLTSHPAGATNYIQADLRDLDDADPVLTALRHLVMHDPAEGVRAVRRAFRAHASGVRQVNRTILLAEAYQRHGQIAEAVRAGYDAAVAARPYDLRHHVIALGIGADLAICDRRPTAVQACTTFFQATTQQPQPDLLRVILAGALRAVAIYQHQSCREAHHQLQVLAARTPADSAAAAALDAGLAAMDAGCVPGCVPPPVGPLPPLPGAVLDPDVTAVDVGVFARRVRLHPATHTCEFAATDQQPPAGSRP